MRLALGVAAILTATMGTIICSSPIKLSAASPVLITAIQTASSQSASEEMIHLANSSGQTVTLSGWKLLFFSAIPKSFDSPSRNIFLDGVIPLNATSIMGETSVYYKAKEGLLWALDKDTWKWSQTNTSNELNEFVAAPSTEDNASQSVAKSPTKKHASKVKLVKVSNKGVSKAANVISVNNSSTPIQIGVLAGVGSLALLYGEYEYRQDIANAFYKFKSYRANRSVTRTES
jgi:predicted extracellular nuclease